MATNYQHRWGSTNQEQRTPRTSKAVPAREVEYVNCPSCGKVQGAGRLADYGCYACGQMPKEGK